MPPPHAEIVHIHLDISGEIQTWADGTRPAVTPQRISRWVRPHPSPLSQDLSQGFTTTLELCCADSVLSPGLAFLIPQTSSGPRIDSKRSEENRRAIEKTSTSFSNASFNAYQEEFSKTLESTPPTLKTDRTRHIGMVKTKMMRRGDWECFVRETHVPSTKGGGDGCWFFRGRICESRRP